MQLLTPADAAGRVSSALKGAAEATGAGFDYLLRTAKRESSLNPTAQAGTSSARGLFQFIDSTWLEVLKEEGPKLGLADEAADVVKTRSGRYAVQDPARRAELLALRDDPQASALLAGAFTQRNGAALESALGRTPTDGELYAAHFMGAQGASQLITLASANPSASAAAAFPSHASANRSIFFDKGRARSALEVYGKLTATPAAGADAVAVPSVATTAYASVATRRAAPQVEEVGVYNNGVENDKAAFHSMFKTGRRSPVSAYVSQAWAAFGETGLAADARPAAATRAVNAPAYAAAGSVADTAVKASAVDAVTTAATRVRKRVAIPDVASIAAASSVATTATNAAAKPALSSPSFDLIAFLRDAFSGGPAATTTARGGRP